MSMKKLQSDAAPADELLEWSDLVQLTKMGVSTIRRLMAADANPFPKPVKLPSGAIRWRRGAYRKWVERLPEVELTDGDLADAPEAAGGGK